MIVAVLVFEVLKLDKSLYYYRFLLYESWLNRCQCNWAHIQKFEQSYNIIALIIQDQ